MTDTQLAYIAGIIDGEGHVGSQLTGGGEYPNPLVQVCMVAPHVIEFLHLHCGGGCTRNNKDLFVWYVTGKAVADFLTVILPYLLIKKTAAELAIKLSSMIGEGGRSKLVTDAEKLTRLKIHWAIKEQNALYNKGVKTLETNR